ncbi:cyclopropane-fatty-acyl-phospholipid synthase family protein [Actinophytocola sp.]|uniref:cyclopropane-fatty-acyl-phospholipid synthase family protein n=1 Tax=Actinophytocola sp. TaxID=1872138 RepID=UPI002D2A812B|nr:cyclopropane-fatty-acyl-phospholipid synthase family protein [Actinophytocola sp.]HYQ69502.1 cyclopropane-fatty-acyl-phospholipid synthase family protein [Actinophytocola sp.]
MTVHDQTGPSVPTATGTPGPGETEQWQLTAPHAPVRAAIAERVFRHAARNLAVTVSFPDGTRLGRGGPLLRVVRPAPFFHRLGAQGNIGFGEAYMAGDWESPDLAAALTPFAERMATLVPPPLQALRRLVDVRRPPVERNTPDGARSNIQRHYDLSNELFEVFLDESMTYSSAWFGPGDDLCAAQLRKIDGILDYAGVRDGSRVLEIGTGWGALAIRAARRGATVTSLTISVEQRELARLRVAAAGLSDRVSVELRDYRAATGTYDAVVSVEMIEAVGEEFWPAYFRTLARVLAPGGRVGLQAITMPHDRLLATRHANNWIQKYIFPGGLLPSVPVVESQAARAGLSVVTRRSLGPHYARTLASWRSRFLAAWDRVDALGFDPVFERMWEFYLAYSEAGFRSRYLDVWQFGLRSAG